jgi:hypothetical protein
VDTVGDAVVIGALESASLEGEVRRLLARAGFRLVAYPLNGLQELPPGTGPIAFVRSEDTSSVDALRLRRSDLGPWLSIPCRDERMSPLPPEPRLLPCCCEGRSTPS